MDQYVEKSVLSATKVIEEQLDAEIEKLERLDEDDLEKIRRKRIQQMKQAAAQKQEWINNGHGKYEELASEKEFFDICKKSNKVVCHFFRDTTMRCKIFDKHLTIIAPKHLETRFVKINVERAPFLCDRLHIRILPTIGIVVDSKTKDFIKGFDDLGGVDDFSTEMLEWRLGCSDAITYSGNLLEPPSNGQSKDKSSVHRVQKTIKESHLSSDEDDD